MIEEAQKLVFRDHWNHCHLGAEDLNSETGLDFFVYFFQFCWAASKYQWKKVKIKYWKQKISIITNQLRSVKKNYKIKIIEKWEIELYEE